MKVGIFSKADGTLQSSYVADAPHQATYGGPWGRESDTTHLEIAAGLDDQACSMVDGAIVEDAAKKAVNLAASAIARSEAAVAGAMSIGAQMIKEFAAENVRMGITADGKTGMVLNAMDSVITALQSGSLYEAITRAKALPAASKDTKYITDVRLLAFVNKIESKLGIALSSTL